MKNNNSIINNTIINNKATTSFTTNSGTKIMRLLPINQIAKIGLSFRNIMQSMINNSTNFTANTIIIKPTNNLNIHVKNFYFKTIISINNTTTFTSNGIKQTLFTFKYKFITSCNKNFKTNNSFALN